MTAWMVSCHNEWCGGPENHTIASERPPESGVKCPTCGWLALHGCGIRSIAAPPPRKRWVIEAENREKTL
jgi:hypothetical protein